MKDIQRDGWEYELTVSLNVDRDTHMASASKDRTGLFEGTQPFIITEETGAKILEWCNSGISKEEQEKREQDETEADRQLALAEYKKLVNDAPVLSKEEQEKFLPSDVDTWSTGKLAAATIKVKAVITEKQSKLTAA